tara:strand:- start:120 stop:329 length:210 start_codon:yes stop_codon:yes gene_type:complete
MGLRVYPIDFFGRLYLHSYEVPEAREVAALPGKLRAIEEMEYLSTMLKNFFCSGEAYSVTLVPYLAKTH